MNFICLLSEWNLDIKNEHYLKRLVKFLNYKKENPSKGKNHKHHIIPRSWNTEYVNDVDNIVYLTPREHLFVHYLMTKAFPKNYQMAYAFQRLCNGEINTKENVRLSHIFALEKNREHNIYKHPPEIIQKAIDTRKNNGSNFSRIKGKKCYNNGKIDKYFFENEIEDGFVLGSLQKGKTKNIRRGELTLLKVSLKLKDIVNDRFKNGWSNRATIKGETNMFSGSKIMHDPLTLKNYRIFKNEEIPENLIEGYYYDPVVWNERNKKISNKLKGLSHPWQDKVNKNPKKIAKTAEWHRGKKRGAETRRKQSEAKRRFYDNGGKNPIQGLKCAYNVKTLELKYFDPLCELPIEFEWGNSKTKKFKFVSEQGEIKSFKIKDAPQGWRRIQCVAM